MAGSTVVQHLPCADWNRTGNVFSQRRKVSVDRSSFGCVGSLCSACGAPTERRRFVDRVEAKFHYTGPTRLRRRPGSATKSADFVWSGPVQSGPCSGICHLALWLLGGGGIPPTESTNERSDIGHNNNNAVIDRRLRPQCCHLESYFKRPKSSITAHSL